MSESPYFMFLHIHYFVEWGLKPHYSQWLVLLHGKQCEDMVPRQSYKGSRLRFVEQRDAYLNNRCLVIVVQLHFWYLHFTLYRLSVDDSTFMANNNEFIRNHIHGSDVGPHHVELLAYRHVLLWIKNLENSLFHNDYQFFFVCYVPCLKDCSLLIQSMWDLQVIVLWFVANYNHLTIMRDHSYLIVEVWKILQHPVYIVFSLNLFIRYYMLLIDFDIYYFCWEVALRMH